MIVRHKITTFLWSSCETNCRAAPQETVQTCPENGVKTSAIGHEHELTAAQGSVAQIHGQEAVSDVSESCTIRGLLR